MCHPSQLPFCKGPVQLQLRILELVATAHVTTHTPNILSFAALQLVVHRTRRLRVLQIAVRAMQRHEEESLRSHNKMLPKRKLLLLKKLSSDKCLCNVYAHKRNSQVCVHVAKRSYPSNCNQLLLVIFLNCDC